MHKQIQIMFGCGGNEDVEIVVWSHKKYRQNKERKEKRETNNYVGTRLTVMNAATC